MLTREGMIRGNPLLLCAPRCLRLLSCAKRDERDRNYRRNLGLGDARRKLRLVNKILPRFLFFSFPFLKGKQTAGRFVAPKKNSSQLRVERWLVSSSKRKSNRWFLNLSRISRKIFLVVEKDINHVKKRNGKLAWRKLSRLEKEKRKKKNT